MPDGEEENAHPPDWLAAKVNEIRTSGKDATMRKAKKGRKKKK